MSETVFRALVAVIGLGFALLFVILVVPPLLANPDVPGAAMAGFVNPSAAGYASDAIACWLILAVWVGYEAAHRGVRHGWVCLLLGVVPGVATGLAAYLLLRHAQASARDL